MQAQVRSLAELAVIAERLGLLPERKSEWRETQVNPLEDAANFNQVDTFGDPRGGSQPAPFLSHSSDWGSDHYLAWR